MYMIIVHVLLNEKGVILAKAKESHIDIIVVSYCQCYKNTIPWVGFILSITREIIVFSFNYLS